MSIWPAGIASNSNLYVAVDFPLSVTTLNGNVTSSAVTIILASAANYPNSGGFVFIDSELIKYTGVSGNSLTGCVRGIDGTTAAPHTSGTIVNLVSVAEHHNALKDEIIAIETSLVLTPNQAVVSNGSGLVSSSSTTATELGYVHGVTSPIQTQFNNTFNTAGTGLMSAGSTVSLAIPVSVADGGTGQTTYTDGQLLIGNSTGSTLTVSTLGGTSNQIIVTNGHGSITLSTPQNIGTTSTPAFSGLTLSNTGLSIQDTEGLPKTVTITSPTTLTSTWTLALPVSPGTNGYYLQTDGSGNTTWALAQRNLSTTVAGSGSLTVSATTADTFIVTIGTATTINGPTGGYDGQKLLFRLVQDGTGHTVTFASGSGNFEFGTDIPSFTASGANLIDYVGAVYNFGRGKWDIVSAVKGF